MLRVQGPSRRSVSMCLQRPVCLQALLCTASPHLHRVPAPIPSETLVHARLGLLCNRHGFTAAACVRTGQFYLRAGAPQSADYPRVFCVRFCGTTGTCAADFCVYARMQKTSAASSYIHRVEEPTETRHDTKSQPVDKGRVG